MNNIYFCISFFFIATAFTCLFPAKWFNRSDVKDSELSFAGGICSGIALTCFVMGFIW